MIVPNVNQISQPERPKPAIITYISGGGLDGCTFRGAVIIAIANIFSFGRSSKSNFVCVFSATLFFQMEN